MITVIYRIYEVNTNHKDLIENNNYFWYNGSNDTIIEQNMLQCETREEFKDIIRSLYGEDIKFKKSTKLKPGDIYCTIISYDAYGTSDYLNLEKNICTCCGKEYCETARTRLKTITSDILYAEANKDRLILDSVYERWLDIKYDKSYDRISKLDSLHFCCLDCKNKYINNVIIPQLITESNEIKSDPEYIPENFIDKDSYSSYNHGGYIYKITKKSTGQFYVGQTKYNPIFRWGQHLLTERFNLNDICDYKFEVLEIVNNQSELLDREAYWINKTHDENPSLSLNIVIPKKYNENEIQQKENCNDGR